MANQPDTFHGIIAEALTWPECPLFEVTTIAGARHIGIVDYDVKLTDQLLHLEGWDNALTTIRFDQVAVLRLVQSGWPAWAKREITEES